MWDPVVAKLRPHGFHVVMYDVRGAGSSGVPTGRAGYRCDVLVDGSGRAPQARRVLTGVLNQDLDRICSDVRVVELDAGHWVTCTHPRQVAASVGEQVRRGLGAQA